MAERGPIGETSGMDRFHVILLARALRFYKKCPPDLADRFNACFEALEQNPFSDPHIKQLRSDRKLYRYRVGDYRVIYEIDKKTHKVGVLLISPRPSAYRNI